MGDFEDAVRLANETKEAEQVTLRASSPNMANYTHVSRTGGMRPIDAALSQHPAQISGVIGSIGQATGPPRGSLAGLENPHSVPIELDGTGWENPKLRPVPTATNTIPSVTAANLRPSQALSTVVDYRFGRGIAATRLASKLL